MVRTAHQQTHVPPCPIGVNPPIIEADMTTVRRGAVAFLSLLILAATAAAQ